MVQSIFDDTDEQKPRAPGDSTRTHVSPPEPSPAVPEPYLSEPLIDSAPSDRHEQTTAFPEIPPTQLDGTPRHNLYAEPPAPTFIDSPGETARRSGLAWSAGVVFLGAVVFMMFLGWGADLLFGSSPWGLVAGIVLGSTIGFIQFFRISSQIFPSSGQDRDVPSLLSDDRDRDGRL